MVCLFIACSISSYANKVNKIFEKTKKVKNEEKKNY